MKSIKLKQSSLNKDWSKNFMDERHYDVLFSEDVRVFKPDGSPLLVLLKGVLKPDLISQAWDCLKKVNGRTENRTVASGIGLENRKKQDGTLSKTFSVPKGWEVHSAILGNFERTIRMPYAHECSWNAAFPHLFRKTWPLLEQCSGVFKDQVTDRYLVQKGFCDRTNPDWVIPGTVYTTITVNKNFRTAAHMDAGDLVAGFSNMAVLKEGLQKGGDLVLPNWRIAAQLDHGDLILFDAHEFHGNTQHVPISKDAVRCSIVMYYREKMVHCKSAKDELKIAKNRKPGDPMFPEVV